jgi:5'-phosphate synthase pdxT subunit
MKPIRIGVLGLQGDVSEHILMVNNTIKKMGLYGEALSVKNTTQINEIDGLIIPGGESTTIGKMTDHNNLFTKIREKAISNMPILGTCAGLAFLAKKVKDAILGEINQPILEILGVEITRNAFGRQRESFEANISIPIIGEEPFLGVFIRSPLIASIMDEGVEILSTFKDKIVAVRQNNILGVTFHPELSGDIRIHKLFVEDVTSFIKK